MQYNMPIIVPDKNIDYKIQIIRPDPRIDYKIQQSNPNGWSSEWSGAQSYRDQLNAKIKSLEDDLKSHRAAGKKVAPLPGVKK